MHGSSDLLDIFGCLFSQVCSLQQRSAVRHLPSFGFIESRNADIGVKIVDNKLDDSSFDIIFSMRFLKEVTKDIGKLEFHTVPVCRSHIERVEKKWVEIHPTSPNSYELLIKAVSKQATDSKEDYNVRSLLGEKDTTRIEKRKRVSSRATEEAELEEREKGEKKKKKPLL
ncbi:hypothetical protein ACLOJK_019694 [Asimina triloba]